MPFAPVLTKGLFDIEVEAGERVLELLKSRKLIEERDGRVFIRKIPGWRRRVQEFLREEDVDLTVSVVNGRIVYSFVDRRELERMKERLDREIREAFPTAYELYMKYQRELLRREQILIDSDGDCEIWEG